MPCCVSLVSCVRSCVPAARRVTWGACSRSERSSMHWYKCAVWQRQSKEEEDEGTNDISPSNRVRRVKMSNLAPTLTPPPYRLPWARHPERRRVGDRLSRIRPPPTTHMTSWTRRTPAADVATPALPQPGPPPPIAQMTSWTTTAAAAHVADDARPAVHDQEAGAAVPSCE